MNIFELAAKITADTSDFDSKVGSMVSSGVKKFTALTAAAGAATAAFVGKAVSTGMDFDKAMSQVQATMLKTDEQMEKSVGNSSSAYGEFTGNLREFAQFLGENTVFSATQAAEALNFMALAGYDTQQSMDMLPNVLSLAAAGNFDLARASDMVTDTQTAFGISAGRTTQLVDEMAKTASISNTSVEQMGDAFLVVGGLAQELNGGMITLADGTQKPVDGIQELEIALGAMANAGIKGSEAGTHMRNMLMKLSGPTEEGALLLEELGVHVFDTEGNMRSLSDIFGDLNREFSHMTQEGKIESIQALFNTRDLASAEAILNAIESDWDEIGEGILNADGAAAEMANIQLDNLKGDITLAKSAFEGLQIAISDEAAPALRKFVQKGTEWLGKLTKSVREGKLHEWFGKLRETLGRLKQAVSPVGEALKRFFTNAQNGKAATSILSRAINAVITVVGKLSKGIAFVIDKISAFIGWLTSGSKSAEAFKTIILAVATGITTLLGIIKGVTVVGKVIKSIQALSGVFSFLAANPIVLVIAAIAALVAALVYLYNHNEKFRNKVQEIWGKIKDFFSTTAEAIKVIWQKVVEFFTQAWEAIKLVWGVVAQYFQNVWDSIKIIFEVVKDVLTGDFQGAWEGIKSIVGLWSDYFSGIWELIKAVFEPVGDWFKEKFGGAWEAIKIIWDLVVEYFQNVWDSIKLIFEVVKDVFTGDFQGAWDGIKAIIDLWEGYFSDIWDAIKGIFKPVTDWFEEKFGDAWDKIEDIWDDVVDYFQNIWDSIKLIFDVVKSVLSGDFKGAWDGIKAIIDLWANYFNDVWEDIKDVFEGVADWFKEKFQAAWDAIKAPFEEVGDFFGGIKDKIVGFFTFDDAGTWGSNLTGDFTGGVNDYNRQRSLSDSLSAISGSVLNAFSSGSAFTWGSDLMANFVNGIYNSWSWLTDACTSIANTIASFIGFSEPDEGPLSRFHTFAPDMMELFTKGIEDNEDMLRDQIAKSFDFEDLINREYDIDANVYDKRRHEEDERQQVEPVNVTINVYATERQDAKELAREVQREFIQWENQRKAAYA